MSSLHVINQTHLWLLPYMGTATLVRLPILLFGASIYLKHSSCLCVESLCHYAATLKLQLLCIALIAIDVSGRNRGSLLSCVQANKDYMPFETGYVPPVKQPDRGPL